MLVSLDMQSEVSDLRCALGCGQIHAGTNIGGAKKESDGLGILKGCSSCRKLEVADLVAS